MSGEVALSLFTSGPVSFVGGRAYVVEPVEKRAASSLILDLHYAHRWPSVSYCYGLIRDGELVGVVTYGTPPSAPLRSGIAGSEYADRVLELNRLVLRDNLPHEASHLVGKSLRQLPHERIIISFADTAQGHTGTVYQATNFLYCGLSAKRTDWKVAGLEHLHGVSVADMSRGHPNRVAWMRQRFGDDFYLGDRPRKHRYIYFVGSKSFRRAARRALRYPIEPYPKPVAA